MKTYSKITTGIPTPAGEPIFVECGNSVDGVQREGRVRNAALLHPRTGREIDPDRTPLDATALAYLCHKCRWWMTAVAKQPDSPFSGRYSTLTRVLDWIEKHPEFRAQRYFEERAREVASAREFDARLREITSGRRRDDRDSGRRNRGDRTREVRYSKSLVDAVD